MITFPSNTKETIDAIRETIGREIEIFYVYSSYACPAANCELDPVTNTSTNSFCPTCSGVYWIPVISGYPIQAHITWGSSDELQWVPGGQYFDGYCRVQVVYSSYINDIIDASEYFVVDEKKLEVESKRLRGVPTINRILVDLKEFER